MNRIKSYFQSLPISFSTALLVTILIAVLTTASTVIIQMAKETIVTHTKSDVMLFPVLNYFSWLFIAPLIYAMVLYAQRNSETGTLRRGLLIILLSLGFMVFHEVVALILFHIIRVVDLGIRNRLNEFALDVSAGLLGLIKTYMEFWVIYYVLGHFHTKKKYREAELRNAQLESSLFKAQMSALKNQLHPHFLFNTFNTISSLMEEDVELAQRMISKLGALLRNILNKGDQQLISLDEELEFIKLYMELEQIRFKDRLVSRFAIDPETGKVLIPTLLLQPGIENAIKHGFYKKLDECEIGIRTTLDDSYLTIQVLDNGNGVKSEAVSFGMGLKNMEERLSKCYDNQYQLSAAQVEEGFLLEIKIRKEVLRYEH